MRLGNAAFVYFIDGGLKSLFPSMLSSELPDSSEKNCDLTTRNRAVVQSFRLLFYVVTLAF